MNITSIFTNFIARDQLVLDNDEIVKFCYRQRLISTTRVISNDGGWQSPDLEKSDQLLPLYKLISDRLNSVHSQLGLNDNMCQFITNMWININIPGTYNVVHRHGQSCLSGVYYVQTDSDSGMIEFTNPNPLVEFVIPEKLISTPNDMNCNLYSISPNIGDLIIFPSWLSHYTKLNRSKHDRISIAFNSIAVDKSSVK
jgi:uncharacterized protein (TIGR02466 family)